MGNTLKKMAELTYAELTKGRDSTLLPHTHIFTSLKNVVISATLKLINQYIFKPKCNCRRKSMQEKESIMAFLVQIESPVTQDNCSASLGKPRDAEQLQNFQSAAHSH